MTSSTSLARPLRTPALAMAAWLFLGAAPLRGAPTLTARSSTPQIRKEQDAKLYFSIAAQEGLGEIDVALTPPRGFSVTRKTKRVPTELETGSTFTVVYTVTPPGRAASSSLIRREATPGKTRPSCSTSDTAFRGAMAARGDFINRRS